MKINIKAIPTAAQRYETWGDWWFSEDGTLEIRVSDDEPALTTENHKFLIALHELVEVWLCKNRGITQQQVDNFDFKNQDVEGEPGDLPDAPYRKEHRFAMIIEHMMAHELGMAGYGKVE